MGLANKLVMVVLVVVLGYMVWQYVLPTIQSVQGQQASSTNQLMADRLSAAMRTPVLVASGPDLKFVNGEIYTTAGLAVNVSALTFKCDPALPCNASENFLRIKGDFTTRVRAVCDHQIKCIIGLGEVDITN